MKAAEDDFVIYKHEWFQGGINLGPYGRYHLNEIVRRLGGVPFPVVIQADFNEELNAARQQAIVRYLNYSGYHDAAMRVIVAFPRAEGLFGDEAFRIYTGILRGGTRSGGISGSGALGIGTSSMGGFGGGGRTGGY
jgi:hypothetical protein